MIDGRHRSEACRALGIEPLTKMVLYLQDTASYVERQAVFNSAQGRPAGAPLYRLVSPQGMVLETTEGLRQPLADEAHALFADATIESAGL